MFIIISVLVFAYFLQHLREVNSSNLKNINYFMNVRIRFSIMYNGSFENKEFSE